MNRMYKFIENFNIYPKAEIIGDPQLSEFDLTEKKGYQKYVRVTKRFLFGSYTDYYECPNLSYKDLYLILVRLNLNHVIIMGFLNLCIKFGGLLVFVVYAICSVLISPGLSNLYVSMGAYSERTFMNVWEMVPLFKGFQYISIVNIVIRMTREAIFGGLYLRLMFLSFKEIPWGMCNDMSCKWEQTEECSQTTLNTPNKVLKLGMFKYINEEILEINNPKSRIIWQWTLYILLFGIVITLVLLIRIKYYKLFILRLFPVFILTYTVFTFTVILLYYKTPIPTMIRTRPVNISNVAIWLHVLSVVMQEELPSHWVTVGCFAKKSVKLEQYIWFIHCFNVIIKLGVLLFMPFLFGGIQIVHDIKNHDCIFFDGLHVFTTVIPQLIYFSTCYRALVIIYFLGLTLWSLNVIVLNIDLLHMALVHTYPKLYRFRNLLLILLSSAVIITACGFARSNIMIINDNINGQMMFVAKQFTFLFIMIILGVYTLRRLNGDHYYIYGREYPHVAKIKLMVLTISIAFVMFMMQLVKEFQRNTSNYHAYRICGLMLFAPIFAAMLINAISSRKKVSVLQPLSLWGPPQEEDRYARRMLNLNLMFVYRTKLQCRHNCLLGTDLSLLNIMPSFKIEKRVSSENKNALLRRARYTLSHESLML